MTNCSKLTIEAFDKKKNKKKTKKKKVHGPFLWIRFNCLKATEPLQGYFFH